MSRPRCERRLGAPLAGRSFKPSGVPRTELEEVLLGFDEAEALRLADWEGLYQEAAARSMGVSRATFGRTLAAARRKTADAILNGKALRIDGGKVAVGAQGERTMKIAVPSQDGQIDQHFGHCREYLLFSVEGQAVAAPETLPAPEGCGCKSNVAALLAQRGVTHLLAGNMGDGAAKVLGSHGITVVRGASGDARRAADALAAGAIGDSGLRCGGHGSDGGHACPH